MESRGRFEQLFFKVLKENNTAGAGGSLGEPDVPYANDDARIPKLLGQGKVQTRKGSTGGKKNKKKKTDGLDEVYLTGKENEEGVPEEDAEKKKADRCKRKADSVYGKKTSAYKSGAIVRCRQGKIWKKKK
tara:strand:- start:986 stop:1378 length:393 start_codon:yes stop_codon:yes gene_type:complete